MLGSRFPITTSVVNMVVITKELASKKALEACGITHTQLRMLSVAAGSEEGEELAALSRKLRISRCQTYVAARDLAEKGLAIGVEGDQGKRALRIIATERGKTAEKAAAEALVRASKGIMDGIPAEVDAFLAASEQVPLMKSNPSFKEFVLGHVEGSARIYHSMLGACRKADVSLLEYRVLLYLLEFPETSLQVEVANGLLAAKSNLSVSMKQLKRGGLISTPTAKTEGFSVTASGKRLAAHVTASVDASFMEMHGSHSPELRTSIVEMYEAGIREYRRISTKTTASVDNVRATPSKLYH